MFDPTIFDNLKVVFEGKLYDLESQENMLVIGREDRIDIASFGRIFTMKLQRPDGHCSVQLKIASGLPDFAGELRGLRLIDEEPGAQLQLDFELPGDRAERAYEFHKLLDDLWGSTADIQHIRTYCLAPYPNMAGTPDQGIYLIQLTFLQKIDESHIGDVDSLMEHMLATIDFLES